MHKRATVVTNDPQNPSLILEISGKVDQFAVLSPRMVKLIGDVGESLSVSVSIVPAEQYPFKVIDVSAREGKNIQYKLTPAAQSGKSGYLLTVDNIRKESGRYFDMIRLKTDSRTKPQIDIRVYGNIYPKPQQRLPQQTTESP